MDRKVDIWIEGNTAGDYSKLELYKDEKITINSSIQNINDISKVYTDFSQSFTIPASVVNNKALHHFYQSDVDIETDVDGNLLWNPNYRRKAFIEIDFTPFKTGFISIEKSNITNGNVESYSITFYGDLISLKDKFGDDNLRDLDFTSYEHDYTGAEVQARITTDTDEDVCYPLICNKAATWTYDDATSTDITTTAGRIEWTELFPALKVARIMDAIESKYGLTFNSAFFSANNLRWEKLYMLFKNQETNISTSGNKVVRFEGITKQTNPTYNIVDTTNHTITLKPRNYCNKTKINLSVNIVSGTPNYKIDVMVNGKLDRTLEGNTNQLFTAYNKVPPPQSDDVVQFLIRVDNPCTYYINFSVIRQYDLQANYGVGTGEQYETNIYSYVTPLTLKSGLSYKAPDIKISDFFSGILKMFNLTCYATSVDTFVIEPLDDWYSQGRVIDVTKYVDTDNIDISKHSLYKTLSFKYSDCKSIINYGYLQNYNKSFGDILQANTYEGGEYKIDLPFENLLPDRFPNENLQVSYCVDKDYKTYVPKPVMLYRGDQTNHNGFEFYNGTTQDNLTTFVPFGNEVGYNNHLYSLNWGVEYSTLYADTQLDNSLYNVYYDSYMKNLFNPKNRLTQVKTHLPISLLTQIKLNDRLIIRDKRYIVNDMKIDLTSGDVDLSLINDFRPVVNATQDLSIGDDGGTTVIGVPVPTGTTVTISSGTPGVGITPTVFTTPGTTTVTVPANTYPAGYLLAENGDAIITEDLYNIITESATAQYIDINFLTTWADGSTTNNVLYITQPG